MTRPAPAVRSTRQRAAISAVLGRVGGFRSAQDIHRELDREGTGVGLTTVYRTLSTLAEAGEVDVLRSDDGEAVYRRCATEEHHHHIVCRRCGYSVEVAGPEIEQWAARTARRHGFADVSHTVEVFGLCRSCR